MKLTPVLCLILLGSRLGHAQMSLDQKMSDFQQLAGLFSKRYAFTEWKKQAIHFDSLNIAPWLSRINSSKDDLDFFEICMEYVAANQDGHTAFELPSSFTAILNFTVDVYDGKLLIDNIDRKHARTGIFRWTRRTRTGGQTPVRGRPAQLLSHLLPSGDFVGILR